MIAHEAPETQAACAKCARCGRRLTNPKSAERGMGRWCAKKAKTAAVVFEIQATVPAAPAIAPLVALNKTRRSAKFPSLLYEVQTTDRGHYIEFRDGLARDGYELIDGRVCLVWQSDKGVMPSDVATYCKGFAQQLAGVLVRKVA